MAFDRIGAGHGLAACDTFWVVAVGEVRFHVSIAVADVGEGGGEGAVGVEAVELSGRSGGGRWRCVEGSARLLRWLSKKGKAK